MNIRETAEQQENVNVTNPIIEQKEGIKLTKNAKGEMQWEIRILSLDVEQLKKINDDLELKFGKKNIIN